MSHVKVSVLILTYNQEQWIGQAVESALSQNVSFPFEVVIGEDCSTDGTRAVVERYKKNKRPESTTKGTDPEY